RFSRDWSSDVCSSDLYAPNAYFFLLLFLSFSFLTLFLISLTLDDLISPDSYSYLFIPIMTFFGILFCCQCGSYHTNKVQGSALTLLGLYSLVTMIFFCIQIDNTVSWSWHLIFILPFYIPDLLIFIFLVLLFWLRLRLSPENRISNIFYYL